MNVRTALKIKKRYDAAVESSEGNPLLDFKWPGPGPSYSTAQVRQAHNILGLPFEPPKMKGETTAKETAPKKETSEPKTVQADVGAMKVTVEAGKDGELGTKDDEVTIKPKKAAPKKKPKAKKKLTETALKSMKVDELRKLAKAKKVKGYSAMKKDELVKALS